MKFWTSVTEDIPLPSKLSNLLPLPPSPSSQAPPPLQIKCSLNADSKQPLTAYLFFKWFTKQCVYNGPGGLRHSLLQQSSNLQHLSNLALRNTLWIKTTVLLWLKTSWWGVGWTFQPGEYLFWSFPSFTALGWKIRKFLGLLILIAQKNGFDVLNATQNPQLSAKYHFWKN